MKNIIFLIIIAFVLISCSKIQPIEFPPISLEGAFAVTDTNGTPKTVFQSGEDFEISFAVYNNTLMQLSYPYSGFATKMEIWQGDSLIASWFEMVAMTQSIVRIGILKPGQSLEAQWRAPTPLGYSTKIILPPGQYEARVSHEYLFKEYHLPPTDPILFSVTP